MNILPGSTWPTVKKSRPSASGKKIQWPAGFHPAYVLHKLPDVVSQKIVYDIAFVYQGSHMQASDIAELSWDKMQGLLPVIVQDAHTHTVLMLGYMNQEALQATLTTKRVTFYSRSKQRLWTKGETSGNYLQLVGIHKDCILPGDYVSEIADVIKQRQDVMPADSYTAKLLQSGLNRIAQKVGEEGVEVALAAVTESDEALRGEAVDLIFHLLVLLQARNIDWSSIIELMRDRHQILTQQE